MVGDLLIGMYGMDAFPDHFPEPSVRKAMFFAKEFARKTTYGDGTRLPTSETTIRKYFSRFSAVAHLWAAFSCTKTSAPSETRGTCLHQAKLSRIS